MDQLYDHSGLIDLRDERWGSGPREELGGQTAAEMRAWLHEIAAQSATEAIPLSYGPEVSDTGQARSSPAVRLFVEELSPGLFRFLARDKPTG